MHGVGEFKRKWKLTRIPIQDLSEKQYPLWAKRKEEFKQDALKGRWPPYRAPNEIAQSLRRILESWAITNALTYEQKAADWVVRWATDVFRRWDTTPEIRELFPPIQPHYLPELTLPKPPQAYLVIPMECPYRKVGERQRVFSRRVRKAVRHHLQSLQNPLGMLDVMQAPPTGSKAQKARSGAKRRLYLDHLSLALRVCGLQLKEIEAIMKQMGPWGTRCLSTVSRGAAKAAERVHLDLP